MSRALLEGSVLNQISGSATRYPDFQVLVWNPIRNTIAQVVTGTAPDAPVDLTAFIEKVQISENVGFENPTDPKPSQATFNFRRNPQVAAMRRGLIEDGVIVRVLGGDRRVAKQDWTILHTGTFRGKPGEDPGTRATLTDGFSAIAYGREERYLNLTITTDVFPGPVDVGAMAFSIATKPVNQNGMGLGLDEVRFGALGFNSLALSNQIVDTNALQALYECMFPAGRKPKFDAMGLLCAVDVDLDKPAVRIYTSLSTVIRSVLATPNQVEVNNQVILRGLDHVMTKVVQDPQQLSDLNVTTGFFDSSYNHDEYYSQDHTQRAQDTYVVTAKKIKWAKAKWREIDEFHGRISIDTHYLANVRETIFAVYLATQIAIIALDLFFDEASSGVSGIVVTLEDAATGGGTVTFLAALRAALQTTAQIALAGLLWAMNYIGSGEYQIWGSPFEYVYQELVSDNRLVGLDPSELRPYDYRNDFVSQIEDLDVLGKARLRREMVKNQTFTVELLEDQLLEVDDIIEIDGSRFYIVTADRTMERGGDAILTLTTWKIFDPLNGVAALLSEPQPVEPILGYGRNYGHYYGLGL